MWVVGAIVVLVAVALLSAWLWARWRRGEPPPELTEPEAHPPEGRDPTWDSRERYDDA